MKTRLQLHNELLSFTANVYYHPPSSIKMKFPCIVYNLSNVNKTSADNMGYKYDKRYSVIYITSVPNDDIIMQLLDRFNQCSFDRHYIADGLHHYSFNMYY